jgi:hypothetical protein
LRKKNNYFRQKVCLGAVNSLYTQDNISVRKEQKKPNSIKLPMYTDFEVLKAGTHDKSWYVTVGLGLNAMAVTAEVCPLRTEIGSPSGKRHYIHNMYN